MSLTFHMNGKTEVSVEYKDKIPKDMTAAQFKEKYGVVVWCDYFGCMHNVQVEDTQRTTDSPVVHREMLLTYPDSVSITLPDIATSGDKQ